MCRFGAPILKQLLTIFFLCNMLLLQYSRQAAYLQCKLANSLSSKHCDCEQIMAGEEDSDAHDAPITTASKTYMPDEMFLYTTGFDKKNTCTASKEKPTAFINNFNAQHFTKELIKPPAAYYSYRYF